MCASEKPLAMQGIGTPTEADLLQFMRENRDLIHFLIENQHLIALARIHPEMMEHLYQEIAELSHGYVQLNMKDGEYTGCNGMHQRQAISRRQKARLRTTP